MKRLAVLFSVTILAACAVSVVTTTPQLAPQVQAETVWVGQSVSPADVKRAYRITQQVQNLGTNPSPGQLGTCFQTLIGDEDSPPLPSVCRFEQTEGIPAGICGDDNACSNFGKTVCELGPYGRKGAEVIADYCMIFCSAKPVKDNASLFWLAVECPAE